MKSPTQKNVRKVLPKRIKAWAVFFVDSYGEIDTHLDGADVLVDNDCPSSEPTEAFAVYEKKSTAYSKINGRGNRKVVPCTITITTK